MSRRKAVTAPSYRANAALTCDRTGRSLRRLTGVSPVAGKRWAHPPSAGRPSSGQARKPRRTYRPQGGRLGKDHARQAAEPRRGEYLPLDNRPLHHRIGPQPRGSRCAPRYQRNMRRPHRSQEGRSRDSPQPLRISLSHAGIAASRAPTASLRDELRSPLTRLFLYTRFGLCEGTEERNGLHFALHSVLRGHLNCTIE